MARLSTHTVKSPFAPRSPSDVVDLIAANPLGLVVSLGPTGFGATPLPLLAIVGDDGTVTELFGHFARRNPQVAQLQAAPRALISFQGPNAYIPPRLVSKSDWGPTWNYATVQFETEIRFVPDETDRAIRDLAAFLERDQVERWTPAAMGDRYARMLPNIIAFRARVLSTRATFKLGQDEDAATFAEIVAGLGETDLAALMQQQNAGRSR